MLASAQRQRLMVLHTATSSSHIIYSTFVLGWVQAIAVVLMLNIRLAFTAEVTLRWWSRVSHSLGRSRLVRAVPAKMNG
jgi:hypothetical protein